jgi:hypothetical protein
LTPSLTLRVSVPSGRVHYIRSGGNSSAPGETGGAGLGEFLEALRGREDGFMLGREDPLLRLQAGLRQSFGLVEAASLAEHLAKMAHDREGSGMLGE